MEQEKLENLLKELSGRTSEPARETLASQIKNQISDNPAANKSGLHNIRIIIDLRINKLTAAAAIIFTLLLCIVFFSGQNSTVDGFFQDVKGLAQYIFQADKNNRLADFVKTAGKDETSEMQVKEIVYYGDFDGSAGFDTLLMHWKLDDDKYRVVFSDFRTELVSGTELIKLQAKMLKRLAVK